MAERDAKTARCTLTKWGNSQGLIIPKALCEVLGIKIGDQLDLEATPEGISIQPSERRFSRTRHYTIEELFARYEGDYPAPDDWPLIGDEIAWSSPKGKEIW